MDVANAQGGLDGAAIMGNTTAVVGRPGGGFHGEVQ